MTDIHPVDHDEPAITTPGLAPFVDAARRQPTGPLRVDAETLHRRWQEHIGRRRRHAALGGLAAAGVAGLLWIGAGAGAPTPSSRVATLEPTSPVVAPADRESRSPAPEAGRAVEAPAVIALAQGVEIEAVVEGSPEPTIHDAYVLELKTGGYRVSLVETHEQTPKIVTIRFGGNTVELESGVVVILLTGPEPRITLESGAGTWIDADGNRHPLDVAGEAALAAGPSAAELARQADRELARGDRERAIETLRTLVTAHPRSAATRSGLVDLARLLRAAGRTDEARCAYGLYLERWPHSQLRSEIEGARDRLGAGPDCRGLRPR